MRFTSWDRTDRANPRLQVEEGPETLAVFSAKSAQVAGKVWSLEVDSKEGAQALLADAPSYHLTGNLSRAKKLDANLGGRHFSFVNEQGNDWIIEDSQGQFVAQFSGKNQGVRKSYLEFMHEGAVELSTDEIVALSWFARLILESRLQVSSVAIIATLILASAVAVLTLLF
ncbi:MAG: hypothetical protein SOW59_00560 [Corynebacterium sp.]|nr:hypothetical protein [Corynebacterium sp.]